MHQFNFFLITVVTTYIMLLFIYELYVGNNFYRQTDVFHRSKPMGTKCQLLFLEQKKETPSTLSLAEYKSYKRITAYRYNLFQNKNVIVENFIQQMSVYYRKMLNNRYLSNFAKLILYFSLISNISMFHISYFIVLMSQIFIFFYQVATKRPLSISNEMMCMHISPLYDQWTR